MLLVSDTPPPQHDVDLLLSSTQKPPPSIFILNKTILAPLAFECKIRPQSNAYNYTFYFRSQSCVGVHKRTEPFLKDLWYLSRLLCDSARKGQLTQVTCSARTKVCTSVSCFDQQVGNESPPQSIQFLSKKLT